MFMRRAFSRYLFGSVLWEKPALGVSEHARGTVRVRPGRRMGTGQPLREGGGETRSVVNRARRITGAQGKYPPGASRWDSGPEGCAGGDSLVLRESKYGCFERHF